MYNLCSVVELYSGFEPFNQHPYSRHIQITRGLLQQNSLCVTVQRATVQCEEHRAWVLALSSCVIPSSPLSSNQASFSPLLEYFFLSAKSLLPFWYHLFSLFNADWNPWHQGSKICSPAFPLRAKFPLHLFPVYSLHHVSILLLRKGFQVKPSIWAWRPELSSLYL